MLASNVGEFGSARRVTDSVDPSIGRSQPAVNFDGVLRDFHASGIEAEIGNAGLTPGCNQNCGPFDFLGLAVVVEFDDDFSDGTGNVLNPRAFADSDAFVGKLCEEHGSKLWIFVAMRVSAVEHSYARTETAIGLGQLQSRRSGSDDDEM